MNKLILWLLLVSQSSIILAAHTTQTGEALRDFVGQSEVTYAQLLAKRDMLKQDLHEATKKLGHDKDEIITVIKSHLVAIEAAIKNFKSAGLVHDHNDREEANDQQESWLTKTQQVIIGGTAVSLGALVLALASYDNTAKDGKFFKKPDLERLKSNLKAPFAQSETPEQSSAPATTLAPEEPTTGADPVVIQTPARKPRIPRKTTRASLAPSGGSEQTTPEKPQVVKKTQRKKTA